MGKGAEGAFSAPCAVLFRCPIRGLNPMGKVNILLIIIYTADTELLNNHRRKAAEGLKQAR